MSAFDPPRQTLRSVGAVIAGLLFIVLVSVIADAVMHGTGIFPPVGEPMSDALWLLATAYRTVFGVVGCYIAARLAPARPMLHAWILGGIGVVLSSLGAIATWDQGPGFGPAWYPLAVIAISLPSAWIGGRLALRQQRVQAPA